MRNSAGTIRQILDRNMYLHFSGEMVISERNKKKGIPMKRKEFIAMIPASLLAAKAWAQKQEGAKGKKMLIAYYSWSGNTRHLANIIKEATKADIVEIVPEKPYPSGYRQTVDQAKKEIDAEYKAPIKTKVPNLAEYDIVFVGSPNWWGTISSPVRTFLAENDFSGKKIAPFMTHEGSRMGRAVGDIKKLCGKSEILEALPIRGGAVKNSAEETQNWLKRLGVI